MSAYFVSDATVDAVVTLMRRHNWPAVPDAGWTTTTGAPTYCPQRDPDNAGRQLLRMNLAAMLARYPSIRGTDEHRGYALAIQSYRFAERREGDPTLVKSLACFVYQCDEGGIHKTPLHQVCKLIEHAHTPSKPASAINRGAWAARREYDAAPWGLVE